MALRHLIPNLAFARQVAASCSAATTTIKNAGDTAAFSTSSTFSGNIAIATDTSGHIALDGIQRITGSLVASNVLSMASLSGDSLSRIDDSFDLNNLQVLSTLNFPALVAVDTVNWSGLPNLQGLSFTAGLQEASTVSIQNTILGSLNGIDLQVVDNLIIANYLYLNQVSIQLGNVSTSLQVEANGKNFNINLPYLDWAYNRTFSNCSSVRIPSLAAVNGSLGFYTNYFSSVSAPRLTIVGGNLAVVDNNHLANLDMTGLTTVNGELNIVDNTELKAVSGFPRLAYVHNFECLGIFDTVQLPQLYDVPASFNLQSSENIASTCSHFEALSSSNSVIKGKFLCEGKANSGPKGSVAQASGAQKSNVQSTAAKTGGARPSDTQTGGQQSAGEHNRTSDRVKIGVGVGVGVGGALLVTGLAFLALRRRRYAKSAPAETHSEKDGVEVDRAAMLGNDGEKHELEQPLAQMPLGNEAQELPAEHGQSELAHAWSTKAPAGIE